MHRKLASRQLRDGLLTQLRSIPIEARVDAFLAEQYPELFSVQLECLDSQRRRDRLILEGRVRSNTPPRIWTVSAAMNAANAVHSDGIMGTKRYGSKWRSATAAYRRARDLLDILDELKPEAKHDRELISTWAETLGLKGWFQWVPYGR